MAVGDVVLFRAFDVDDPSTDKVIDGNGGDGADNRGTLSTTLHAPGASKATTAGGSHGRLRSVNAGNVVQNPWAAAGSIVSAKVKEQIDKNGNVVRGGDGNPVLVAETDLLTTFNPGDNYRVVAVPERMREALTRLGVKASATPVIGTSEAKPYFTPQLSVWRHLHVEADAAAASFGLMGATTNRQENRFADAYLQPNYDVVAAKNAGAPVGGALIVDLVAGSPTQGTTDLRQEEAVRLKRETEKLESPVFWVVYVTDTYTQPAAAIFGVTLNRNNTQPWQASFVFSTDITAFFGAGAATAINKTVVHEVGHQVLRTAGGLDKDGHRGSMADVEAYYALSDLNKADPKRAEKVNIMTATTLQVPMNNGGATLPGKPGSAGPFDMFYFYSFDIDTMRRRNDSP